MFPLGPPIGGDLRMCRKGKDIASYGKFVKAIDILCVIYCKQDFRAYQPIACNEKKKSNSASVLYRSRHNVQYKHPAEKDEHLGNGNI